MVVYTTQAEGLLCIPAVASWVGDTIMARQAGRSNVHALTMDVIAFLVVLLAIGLISPTLGVSDDQQIDREVALLDRYLFLGDDNARFIYWGDKDLRVAALFPEEFKETIFGVIKEITKMAPNSVVITMNNANVAIVAGRTFEEVVDKYEVVLQAISTPEEIDGLISGARDAYSPFFISYLVDEDGRVEFCLLVLELHLIAGVGGQDVFEGLWTRVAIPKSPLSPTPHLDRDAMKRYFDAPLRAGMTRKEVLSVLKGTDI